MKDGTIQQRSKGLRKAKQQVTEGMKAHRTDVHFLYFCVLDFVTLMLLNLFFVRVNCLLNILKLNYYKH